LVWQLAMTDPARIPVYIIDDDAGMLESMHFLMDSMGIPSAQFSDPHGFLRALAGLQPGCILTDMRMPTMDGLELLETLHSRDINWPVILMSAHLDSETSAHALGAGVVDVLEKPFTAAGLKQVLGRARGQLDNKPLGGAESN